MKATSRTRHAVPRAQLQLLGLHDEMIVDLFAGGGGASTGIEVALGRQVDAAVNHDPAAVALHEANHPQTRHYRRDVFEVEPADVTQGRPVGLLWASPDCTFHSKARGGKPIRSGVRKRRALAWVVTRWAGQVRPRVIMLENVEEFANWGPLVAQRDPGTGRVIRDVRYLGTDGKERVWTEVARPGLSVPLDQQRLVRDPRHASRTFRQWVRSLTDLGYAVEWRELRACDFGAPTIRRRLYLVARCDGAPIVWPDATHGPAGSDLLPYRTAAECIDWSIPCPSIFDRKKPLAENTLKRIGRGVRRYVLENPRPFVVANNTNNAPRAVDDPLGTVTTGGRHILATPFVAPVTHTGERSPHSIKEPVRTITTASRGELALVAPTLAQVGYGEREGQAPRSLDIEQPLGTIVGTSKHALCAAFLAQNNDGPNNGSNAGRSAEAPLSTVTTTGSQQSVITAHIQRDFSGSTGHSADEPLGTVTSGGGGHAGLIATHVTKFRTGSTGHAMGEPLHTITGATSTTEGCRPGGASPLGIVAAHLSHLYTSNTGGGAGNVETPIKTITSGGTHAALVYAFLAKYYGTAVGQDAREALDTITTRDRFGIVTVTIGGDLFVVTDIGLRMLQPRELYNAQGFPTEYQITVWFFDAEKGKWRWLTKTEQVRMVGNSVSPPVAAALAAANCADMVVRHVSGDGARVNTRPEVAYADV